MTISRLNNRAAQSITMAAIGLSMAACQPGANPPANETVEAPTAPDAATIDNGAMAGGRVETKSIIRPGIEPAPTPSPALEPIELTIPFPAKGAQPDQAGMALLDNLIANPIYQMGGPITIWGHSDSTGSDAANLIASRHRAESVRDYLVKKGALPDRITVIALGEARPLAPNRKLDGSDDPEGRDKNRRVEVKVNVPHVDRHASDPAQMPTGIPQ